MFLKSIRLTNFRNQSDVVFEFSPNINIFVGQNGIGKTNLAEAIYYLCFLKSFRTSSEEFVLQKNKNYFNVTGDFGFEEGGNSEVILIYKKGEGKKISQNHKVVNRFSEFIGSHPCVCLTPDDIQISNGSPSGRRKFIDVVISQTSKVYLDSLIRYNKIIKQKNKLLSEFEPKKIDEFLDPWDEELSSYCFEIIRRRKDFLNKISSELSDFYNKLSGGKEEISVSYESSLEFTETQQDIYNELVRKRRIEKARKSAIFGIHRDDVSFKLSGYAARGFASQGQHKTLILALKLAEINFLENEMLESPIAIFDDVFSELDSSRIGEFFKLVGDKTQVFVTTTHEFENLDTEKSSIFRI